MSDNWRRIEDELPEIGVEVITLMGSGDIVSIARWTGEWWLFGRGASSFRNAIKVLAWIPMPTFVE